jgi:elongation factor Tu
MVVFVNKVDLVDDPDLIDLVELETRDLLPRYGFAGDRVEVLGLGGVVETVVTSVEAYNRSQDVAMVMPGDSARVEVRLDKAIAPEAGSCFAIREGGKTVGSGVVSQVLE